MQLVTISRMKMVKIQSVFWSVAVGSACLFSVVRAEDQFTLDTARAAAEKGDAKAEYFLGKQYAKGNGVPLDNAKAAEYFRKAAEQGLAAAQNDLGAYYARGLGVKRDFQEAAKWYTKAALQGDELAEYSLGRAYAEGRGVDKDLRESTKWYRKAAEQNQPDALVVMGDMYLFGDRGSSMKYAEALKYYTNAVAHGQTICLNSLGICYENSPDISDNMGLALKCYRQAAAKNDGRAQANLGRFYQDGIGVQKDLVEAYKWFLLAQRNGAPIAKHSLEQLQGSNPLVQSTNSALTPEQIAEATRRANSLNKL
jgi:TPR repeat protein